MRHQIFKHKMGGWGGGAAPYASPYLLEILATANQANWPIATGSLTAEAPGLQVVSCSRASSAYCLGDDGLLHLLGANTVRVEPSGLLVERASTNIVLGSVSIGDANWTAEANFGGTAPTVTLNSTDVLDPAGGNAASKVVFPATSGGQISSMFQVISGANGARSCYLRCPVGQSFTIYLTNGGTNPTDYVTWNVTDQWQRFSWTTSGTFGGFWRLGFDTRAAGTNTPGGTVYMWGAQAESLSFVTSLIVTTSASATRDADIITCDNPLSLLSQPVPAWKFGCSATPVDNNWGPQGDAAVSVLLNIGLNAATDCTRLLRSGSNTDGQFDGTGATTGYQRLTLGSALTVFPSVLAGGST